MRGPSQARVMAAADRAEARAGYAERKREGRGRLSTMDLVPEDGQDDVQWALGELNNRQRTAADILVELNERLEVKGIDPISKSAFNRRSVKLAAMSNRLNEARHIFEGLAPQFTAEKVDQHTLVLGEFIKILVFELAQNDGGAIGTKGAMELARAHLAVIQGQKISSERRLKLEADFKAQAGEAIEKAVKARGMSAETAEDLRRGLFGVPSHGA